MVDSLRFSLRSLRLWRNKELRAKNAKKNAKERDGTYPLPSKFAAFCFSASLPENAVRTFSRKVARKQGDGGHGIEATQ
jgi:hypothetical protein